MCAVKDVWSNRIVGYSIGPRMQASLAVRALENAVTQRDHPVGTVVHSDRGGQFRSQSFQGALRRHQLQGSMGRVGAAGDNAAMESFFHSLKTEWVGFEDYKTRSEARTSLFDYIELF